MDTADKTDILAVDRQDTKLSSKQCLKPEYHDPEVYKRLFREMHVTQEAWYKVWMLYGTLGL